MALKFVLQVDEDKLDHVVFEERKNMTITNPSLNVGKGSLDFNKIEQFKFLLRVHVVKKQIKSKWHQEFNPAINVSTDFTAT